MQRSYSPEMEQRASLMLRAVELGRLDSPLRPWRRWRGCARRKPLAATSPCHAKRKTRKQKQSQIKLMTCLNEDELGSSWRRAVDSEGLSYVNKGTQGTCAHSAVARHTDRLPVYPRGLTRGAGNIFFVSPTQRKVDDSQTNGTEYFSRRVCRTM